MNLRPRRNEEPDVSLTPLIDVVFLLLIFFMVSTTFRKESEFDIELPQATQEPVETAPSQLVIAIDIDGRYAINDQPLADNTFDALLAALNQVEVEDRTLPVLIRADQNTAHQAVVSALDAAGKAGFRRIGMATTLRAAGE